jgi:large subunit ribosomal protein L14
MAEKAKGRGFASRRLLGYKPKITRGLNNGSVIKCADNSGAKVLKIIQVLAYKGRLRRVPKASVGDMVIVSVKKGSPDMRKKLFQAVIIRQKKAYRRPEGHWVEFEDNAAVIISREGEMRGSEIRGPVSREAAERWARIASASTIII